MLSLGIHVDRRSIPRTRQLVRHRARIPALCGHILYQLVCPPCQIILINKISNDPDFGCIDVRSASLRASRGLLHRNSCAFTSISDNFQSSRLAILTIGPKSRQIRTLFLRTYRGACRSQALGYECCATRNRSGPGVRSENSMAPRTKLCRGTKRFLGKGNLATYGPLHSCE